MLRRRMTPMWDKDEGSEIPAWGKELQAELAKLAKGKEDNPNTGSPDPQPIPKPTPPAPEESETSESSETEEPAQTPKRSLWDFLK